MSESVQNLRDLIQWIKEHGTAATAERIADLQAKLEEMTKDRNLWQGEHNEDCPNLAEVKRLRAENATLTAKQFCADNIEDIIRRKNEYFNECERLEEQVARLEKENAALKMLVSDEDHAWTQDQNGVHCKNCGCIDGSTAAAYSCTQEAQKGDGSNGK